MYTRKSHLFHMLNSSPWPMASAFWAFFFLSGLAFYMHSMNSSYFFFFFSFIFLLITVCFWFIDIMNEGTFFGDHTLVVRNGLKMGFLLFVVSEIMLFFGFFWAFFHAAFCPSIELGAHWPPAGMPAISFLDFPALNTLLLVISGLAVTWAHRGFALAFFRGSNQGFLSTLLFGFIFLLFQFIEYMDSPFNISDSVFSSSFYLLTGLHGFHVIVGVTFLFVCYLSFLSNQFLDNHYIGFMFAMWYWHFVDIVWLILFLTVYLWGSL